MKIIYLALSLTLVVYCAESSPVGLESLDFDNLDADLDNLSYEVEEEDLDDYAKLLDDLEANKSNGDNSDLKNTGFKNKKTTNKGSKSKHNTQDRKKIFKVNGVRDRGTYDDDDLYAIAEGVSAKAVGIKGNEDRTYRKGTKTRGFHRVHHKDEYKKDKEFYEDDETKGVIRKTGAKGLGYRIGAGSGLKKGHFNHDRLKSAFGKNGYSDKGFSNKEFNGYSNTQGTDTYFNSDR